MPVPTAEHLHEIAEPHPLDTVRDAWGKDALVAVDAVTVEPELEVDDPLAIFESTFGTGAEIWSTPEGREQLKNMRGSV